jgi:peptidyl-tRNA hydrolase, PTH1 family
VWVVVGLGNPGQEYAATRHNLGFRVVDELLRRAGARARHGAGDYELASARLAGNPVLLVKPTTYVNRSGRALIQLAGRYSFTIAEVVAIVDDVSLPFGKLRLRPGGSAGGHNGLRSLHELLGTDGYARLRIGVGMPPEGADLADFVLEPLGGEAWSGLESAVAGAVEAVELACRQGVPVAMNAFNRDPGAATEPRPARDHAAGESPPGGP